MVCVSIDYSKMPTKQILSLVKEALKAYHNQGVLVEEYKLVKK